MRVAAFEMDERTVLMPSRVSALAVGLVTGWSRTDGHWPTQAGRDFNVRAASPQLGPSEQSGTARVGTVQR